ncbi:hypothetical protein [Calidithermus roseus]|nr:hypothetical protein [Calidithermus roseus]
MKAYWSGMPRSPLVWVGVGLALIVGLFLAVWIFATIWVLGLIGAALAALGYAWQRLLPRRWKRRKLPQLWR